jgi:hydrogenase expression/formation protein HypC
MCLAIPMEVLRMEGSFAWCRPRGGVETRVDTLLTGPLEPGQWILSVLGAAREVVAAEDAAKICDALEVLDAVMTGGPVDIDAAFPDLVGREPQLPPHLQAQLEGEET